MAQTEFLSNSGGPGGDVFTYLCVVRANILFYANFCVTGHQNCSLARWDRAALYPSHFFHGIHHLCQTNLDTRVEFLSRYPDSISSSPQICISVLAYVMSNQENALLSG